MFKPVGKRKQNKQSLESDPHVQYRGNLDLVVLRTTNPTHVTPRIAQMAVPLFREVLQVVGPRPRVEPGVVPKDELTLRLHGFLMRAQARRLVQFRPDQRIRHSRWLKHILIDGVKYEVGTRVFLFFYRLTGG